MKFFFRIGFFCLWCLHFSNELHLKPALQLCWNSFSLIGIGKGSALGEKELLGISEMGDSGKDPPRSTKVTSSWALFWSKFCLDRLWKETDLCQSIFIFARLGKNLQTIAFLIDCCAASIANLRISSFNPVKVFTQVLPIQDQGF